MVLFFVIFNIAKCFALFPNKSFKFALNQVNDCVTHQNFGIIACTGLCSFSECNSIQIGRSPSNQVFLVHNRCLQKCPPVRGLQ